MITDYDDVIDYLNMADMLFANDAYEQGAASLYAVLKLDPNNIDALKRLGKLRMGMGQFKEASECLGKVKKEVPSDEEIDLLILQLDSLKNQDNSDTVEEAPVLEDEAQDNEMEDAGKFSKDYNLLLSGEELLKKGDIKSAEAFFVKVLRDNEASQSALLWLAVCAHQKNDIKLSFKYLDCILLINPHHAEALNQKGVNFYNLGEFEEAKNSFADAIKNDPSLVGAKNNYEDLLAKLQSDVVKI